MLGQEKCPVYVSILLVFAVTASWTAEASNSTELVLAEEGRSDYQIVVPGESSSLEIAEALNQTARFIQCAFKANGFDLPVVSEWDTKTMRNAPLPGEGTDDDTFSR